MISLLKIVVAIAVVIGAAIMLGRVVFPLPRLEDRRESRAIPMDADTTLGGLVAAGQAENPGKTGVLGIAEGRGAIASRLLLARQAEASIDAQYYIWRDDTSGRLMLKALYDAAQRGVRVRLLLDDNGVTGLDETLTALTALDNFEVRLFNPSRVRNPKIAGYLLDFMRMNRRMHNKALIVDGAAAIVGGRNIADEYFQLAEDGFFIDLDVLAAGAVVPQTADIFDAYWNSESAYPADMVTGIAEAKLPDWLTGDGEIGPAADIAAMSEQQGTVADRFVRRQTQMEWVDAQVIADDPAKGLGKASDGGLMITRLRDAAGAVASSIDLVSAYFIPGSEGAAYFEALARRGVKVRVLTNAFLTTDVKLVHAGYAKYRRELLESGIALFELKPEGGEASDLSLMPSSGSSGASLHAKTLAIDGKRLFVGSFNFDPRSAILNCEMGFVIDSPAMAARMAGRFDTFAPSAYAVKLADGRLTWTETGTSGETIHTTEPGMSGFDRWMIHALGWLPIQWLL